jgi:hypothetical protein
MKQHGERSCPEPSAGINGPHVRLQQTATALSLVDRRNSELAERADRGCICPFNVSDCDVSHDQGAPFRDIRSKSKRQIRSVRQWHLSGYGSIIHALHFDPIF